MTPIIGHLQCSPELSPQTRQFHTYPHLNNSTTQHLHDHCDHMDPDSAISQQA